MERNYKKKMHHQYSLPEITPNEYGKLQPQAIELEEDVIGACLIEKDLAVKVSEIISPDDFYKPAHQKIFSSICGLLSKNSPVDIHTVIERLRKDGTLDDVGGIYEIMNIASRVASGSHAIFHSQIIKQKAIARQVIKYSSELQTMAFDERIDIADVIEEAEKKLGDIISDNSEFEISSMSEALEHTINDYIKRARKARNSELVTIPTGLQELDRALNGGWEKSQLIILGGRPSMGKTQFAIHFAKHASMKGIYTLFVSIEMTKEQLITRMITEDEGINYCNLKTGQTTNEEWNLIEIRKRSLSNLKINITDTARHLSTIISIARKLHREGRLGLIIIDYLQYILTNLRFERRDLEVAHITRELKSLAKELRVPIILLAQLNREKDKSSKPQLSDLRESGSIEQDADVVIFPHRPSYYNEDSYDEKGNTWKNRGILYLAKNREGAKDEKVMFTHDNRFKKIWDDKSTPPF